MERLFPHLSLQLDLSNYKSGSFETLHCLSMWSLGQKYQKKKACLRVGCLFFEWYGFSLCFSPLTFLLFLHLEFTVIAFYKLGTFIIRHNWLEDKVLCNRTRYFRNVNRRKRKTQWVSRCLASFFSSFVNNSVGSTQNTKLTTWRIKITSFIVLPHKQQHIVLFHGKIYF